MHTIHTIAFDDDEFVRLSVLSGRYDGMYSDTPIFRMV